MNIKLISIPTETYPLDGLLYQTNKRSMTQQVVQFFHGNTMNFYSGFCKFLPPELIFMNLCSLTYNRRGHDVLTTTDSRRPNGGALQLTTEAIADNNHARDWLIEMGYSAPICIGHSNGGLLATKHAAMHQDTPALILLSAHIGGTNMLPLASSKGLFCQNQLEKYLERAKQMVRNGKGEKIILLPGWYWATTPNSLLDLSKNLPDLLEEAPKVTCPVLFVKGDQEPEDLYPAKAFKDKCNGPVDIITIEDTNHFYIGAEKSLTTTICEWLKTRSSL